MSEPVRWTEARVVAPEGWLELVADALAMRPCQGAAFGRPTLGTDAPPVGHDYVRVFIPDRDDSPELRDAIERSIAGLARRADAAELAGLRVEFRAMPPEDYATSWRKDFKPFRTGRLCVLLPGDERKLRPSDVRLTLEPGGAFGSGRHATTRACLRAAQERVRAGERVLDAGTGSGILAATCVLFGAQSALGFDVDPNAKPYADALARDNGLERRCEFRTGGFEAAGTAEGQFDGLLANISADVLVLEAPRMRRLLRPGGWFALSGCAEPHAARLLETISNVGLRVEQHRIRGRWHTFVGRLESPAWVAPRARESDHSSKLP